MLITPRPANAQNADLDDLRIRVERLEKENQEIATEQVSPPIGDAAQQPGNPQVQAGASPNSAGSRRGRQRPEHQDQPQGRPVPLV